MSETLAALVDRLEVAYETARRVLAESNARYGVPHEPEEMREESGRYILLDALTALVQAKAALEVARPTEGVVARPGDTLIFRVEKGTSPETFERFIKKAEPGIMERLPGVRVVWLAGVDEVAVYRPSEDFQT
ncbi:hypothetical protein AB0I81_22920 [Nonomuraea sp. NPDC050404]|uniref:hypothetical protein n=1 Tax=Nonomuraea sp. NPDC050404 TaxID=3155783 RepID=UPI0033FD2E4D